MIRFVAATLATFALLVLVNTAVTSATDPGLSVSIYSDAEPGAFYVYGDVGSSGSLPATVTLSGMINGTFSVGADGYWEASVPAAPGAHGTVTVTVQHNGETASEWTYVESAYGDPDAPGVDVPGVNF